MKKKVKKWLEDGSVDVFLGYKMVHGHPLPHCFTLEDVAEVDELIVSEARYSLEKIATHLTRQDPKIKIGLLARDCNQRAINILSVWHQLDLEKIKTLNVNCCPSNLKAHPDCSYMTVETPGAYKQQVGIDNTIDTETADAFSKEAKTIRWMYEFQKCIKCYGCRNICPVCFCTECSLEHKDLIGPGNLPPQVPIFHLVRAAHMAGRCIDCGLCEDACPMDIPLRLLYRKVNRIVKDVFDYDTGESSEQSPFSLIGDSVKLTLKPM
jgi:formate dehydrogenase (coenzyme F420) beta subunit